MADATTEAWVNEFLGNLPENDGSSAAEDALESTYGFDPEEFENAVDVLVDGTEVAAGDGPDLMLFALLFFELGYAWHVHKAEAMKDFEGGRRDVEERG